MMQDNERILTRILARCQQEPNGCLIWHGSRVDAGYGKVMVEGKIYRVHRLVYELVVGPIPKGMVLLHSCDTPECCEPGHLSVGTHSDNMRDAGRKGRMSTPHRNSRVLYGARLSNPEDLLERLGRLLARTDWGCLEWQGNIDPGGYGKCRFDGNGYRVHRLMWQLHNGDIPDGLVVIHNCDNRRCCEVSHMRLGTQAENVRDAQEKRRLHSGDMHWSARKAYPAAGDLHYSKVRPESFVLNDPNVRANNVAAHTRGDDHWTRKDPEKAKQVLAYARAVGNLCGERIGTSKLTEQKVREIRDKCASGMTKTAVAQEYSVSVALVSQIVYRKRWQHVA